MKIVNKNDVIKLYSSGMSIFAISKQLGCSFGQCRKILVDNGIRIRSLKESASNRFSISKNQEHIIVNAYLRGKGIRQLCSEFKHGAKTISDILKKHNVRFRQPGKKYNVNEEYFKYIDNIDKAYWLGFILADGCILKNNILQVALKDSDIGHVHKLNKSLSSSYPVKIVRCGKGHRQASLSISCANFVKNLIDIGITNRKSFTSSVPNIDRDLMGCFWRGVFDGDGWIFKSKTRNEWHVGLCGSIDIVVGFKKFIENNIDYMHDKKIVSTSCDKIFKINYVGKALPFRVIRLLYDNDDGIRLDRKNKQYNILKLEAA